MDRKLAEEKALEEPATMEKRPLDDASTNALRTAMGLLIKHRGGGPFGPGRLQRKQLPELESSMVSLLDVLRADLTAAGEAGADDDGTARLLANRQAGEGLPEESEEVDDQTYGGDGRQPSRDNMIDPDDWDSF